jgi:hypothetical protein
MSLFLSHKREKNFVNWVEIPVSDFERAQRFYEILLGTKLEVETSGAYTIGFFPLYKKMVGGAIIQGKGYVPSKEGALVYINAGVNFDLVLNRIESAGGKIVVGKNEIPNGYIARFEDTEGNLLALHAHKKIIV